MMRATRCKTQPTTGKIGAHHEAARPHVYSGEAAYAVLAGPLPTAAWAAARRAIGTRNGEQDT
jgi:hypothetical protein